MRLTVIMTFLALLIMPGIAEPDNVTTGLYKVTFDLGMPKEAYNVDIEDPLTKESLSGEISTKYEIKLINKTGLTRRATIILTSYETEQVIPTQDEFVKGAKYTALQLDDLFDIESAGRKIDGHDGAVVAGKMRSNGMEIDTYSAMYFPSSTTNAVIVSFYPWEQGTLQLLKTIHIEKMN